MVKKGKKNYGEKIQRLKKRLTQSLGNLAIAEEKHTAIILKLGRNFTQLKKRVKEEKHTWLNYFDDNFKIPLRTAQRYMSLAKKVDIKKAPYLVVLSQRVLEGLDMLSDGKGIDEFINDCEVETDFDLKDKKAVNCFRNAISCLLDMDDDDLEKADDKDDDDLDKDDLEENDLEENDLEDDDLEDDDLEDDDLEENHKADEDGKNKGGKKSKPKSKPKFKTQYKKAVESLSSCIEYALKRKSTLKSEEIKELNRLTKDLEGKLNKLKEHLKQATVK